MREVLYLEVPTPDIAAVRTWLQRSYNPPVSPSVFQHSSFRHLSTQKIQTPDGIRLTVQPLSTSEARTSLAEASLPDSSLPGASLAGASLPDSSLADSSPDSSLAGASLVGASLPELSLFVWSVQRTTYLKVFRWSEQPFPQEKHLLQHLTQGLKQQFPPAYPAPPAIDLSKTSIFEALEPYYPQTVHYFRQIPNGEADLTRAYWWEQRWREGVRNPQHPRPVVFVTDENQNNSPAFVKDLMYDLIYVGGALGIIHAAMMATLGYRVLLIERLTFGRMNREWNIARDEFQSLIDLGLFTAGEFEEVIAREYQNGFHKFFDANNPPKARAEILETPTVLNVAIDSDQLLKRCGEKFQAAGGEIWERTEFDRAEIGHDRVTVQVTDLRNQTTQQVQGRLLVDAMGTASPIAWQLNQGRPFDSVCPTVGAVLEGLDPAVWDSDYGDVLNSHGDISRGRQLIWELFPAQDRDLTVYLFHYHQIHPDNPGSLLEMYEDFFAILPEYRRCNLDKLTWKKATFGYIPGYFSAQGHDRRVAFDRLIAIGDAASLQSPLIFTGFGSLVRNLPRLTDLLNTALQHDLLGAASLNRIRAYQSNIAVTWLFSKGMMVPTGQILPPQRINAMLNTFFGILGSEPPALRDAFMKDRADWLSFNRMALKAAWINPALLGWIWNLTGPRDTWRWVASYLNFTLLSWMSYCFRGWLPPLLRHLQPWLEHRFPRIWFWLLVQSYVLTDGLGRPQWQQGESSPSFPTPPNLVHPKVSHH